MSALNPKVVAKIDSAVSAFRTWSQGKRFLGCRVVQYCGIELVGADDVELAEAEWRIRGYLGDGYHIAWDEHEGRLYFCVWEGWDDEVVVPSWQRVFAELNLE